jgi:glycosyltransferase involved in cell wall biosynthesis
MIIAVNTRLLLHDKLEGIGRFTHESLRRITRAHPEHQFVFIFDRPFSDEFIYSDNITPVYGFPPARHPALWYWFFEWSIPAILDRFKADLFLSPDGWLSLRTQVISLPVIHDLNFFHFPEFIPWIERRYYHYFFPRFVRKAHRIATVSEFTRQDISAMFGYRKEDIDITYNGASEGFVPLNKIEQDEVRKTYTNGCPYFLFVGLIHPRKNLANVISAFTVFKREVQSNIKLLIAGARKWWTGELQQAIDNCEFQEDIIFVGRKSHDEVKKITAAALALVYASYFEGFGIPILEAMYCDIPVICSSTTSMPEVGGNAVLYVKPAEADSIKSAMMAIYHDASLRADLIQKARLQRTNFCWDKTAELLWNSIEKCLEI